MSVPVTNVNNATAKVTNVNNTVASMAEAIHGLNGNPSLKLLLDRFDNNSNATNFTALLRAVDKAMRSSGVTRRATPDQLEFLNAGLTEVRTELGLGGNISNIGASVATRTAHTNLSQEGQSIFGGSLAPAVLPRVPVATNDSMSQTFARLGTSEEALASIFNASTQPEAADALPQLLVNLLFDGKLIPFLLGKILLPKLNGVVPVVVEVSYRVTGAVTVAASGAATSVGAINAACLSARYLCNQRCVASWPAVPLIVKSKSVGLRGLKALNSNDCVESGV